MRLLSLAATLALASSCSGVRQRSRADLALESTDLAGETDPLCYAPSTSGNVMPGASSVESCAIWNSLAEMTGAVAIKRDQSSLTLTFGSGPVVFTGTVTGSNVALTYYTLHDFTDGCEWRATETLTGTLDPQSCVMTLSYAYVESVEVSNGACATPCSGDGTFSFDIVPIQ